MAKTSEPSVCCECGCSFQELPAPKPKVVRGARSWQIANDRVEACLTVEGGHLAPVTFDRKGRRIQPYSVAPWAEEKQTADLPTILRVLRGDFFCMPFGGNESPYARERHPIHGETANAPWTLDSLERCGPELTLQVSMKPRIRRCSVVKQLTLRDGENAVYQRHIVSGGRGPMNFGHHATLRFPDPEGSGIISTSPIAYGITPPDPVETPAGKGYSLLVPGQRFKRLDRARTITGGSADLSRYPARRGYEDIAMLVSRQGAKLAWTAVTFPKERFVWFALKDPRVLRSTLMWMSNGGRHYPPWSGRHVNTLGLEEITGYFHYGIAHSAGDNEIARSGDPTCVSLDPTNPLVVNYIMAVAAVPAKFDRVRSIAATRDGVVLSADSGVKVEVPLRPAFLWEA